MATFLSSIPPLLTPTFGGPPPLPTKAPIISVMPPSERVIADRYSLVPTSAVQSINPSMPPPGFDESYRTARPSQDYTLVPDSTQDMVPVVDFDDSIRGIFVATHDMVPVGSKVMIWVDEGVEVEGTVAFHRDPQADAWPGIGVLLSHEDAERVCSFVNHRHTFFFPMDSMLPPA
ncbi:MAG: hypothetical protein AAGE52_03515 [Myxococcota bacterium]